MGKPHSLRNPPPPPKEKEPPAPKPAPTPKEPRTNSPKPIRTAEERARSIEVEVMRPTTPNIRTITSAVEVSTWRAIYLATIEDNGGQIRKAAEAAGVTTTDVWMARTNDQDFAREEVESLRRARTRLNDEAIRRAVDGVVTHRIVKPNGEILEKIDFSDALLIRLLERTETGSWLRKEIKAEATGAVFATRAERKAAIERARAEMAAAQAKLGERPVSNHSEDQADHQPSTE